MTLPKPPTLPHTYTSLPSTLPPSILSSVSAGSGDSAAAEGPPAYVTSHPSADSGPRFAAHPSAIIAQNRSLLATLTDGAVRGRQVVDAWEQEVARRDLAEKRRVAPGWLDSEAKLLSPEHRNTTETAPGPATEIRTAHEKTLEKSEVNLLDAQDWPDGRQRSGEEELGRMMDKAFGRLD